MERAVNHAEIQFVAVGTPPDEDGSADLRYVLEVAKTIVQYMQEKLLLKPERETLRECYTHSPTYSGTTRLTTSQNTHETFLPPTRENPSSRRQSTWL
jgi:UDP-N-acetyl-D-mannosaminuronate dehydrogenase